MEDGEDVKNSAFVRAALEASVLQLKTRVRELTEDVDQLRSSRTQISSETQDFVGYATSELARKDDTIAEQAQALERLRAEHDAELRGLREQMETALTVSASEMQQKERELLKRVQELERGHEQALEYKARKDELEGRIEALQAAAAAAASAHGEALAGLERKYLLERAAIIRESDEKLHQMRRAARSEAQSSIAADMKRALVENNQLSEELALQVSESKTLARERDAAVETARVLSRDADIHAGQEREWARQGAHKSMELRAAAARIKELEMALAMERTDKEMTRQLLTKQAFQQVRVTRVGTGEGARRRFAQACQRAVAR